MTTTFEEAFDGKVQWLAKKLDVTDKLLRALTDNRIITDDHVETIKSAVGDSKKVDHLLRILRRADDDFFPKFCEILQHEDQGQRHVAKKLLEQKSPATDGSTRDQVTCHEDRQRDGV